ncbi:hypothetical protein MNV49_005900 [Pseudohyphozyma bogoriensis]|nr:hypothetical protein MNV49_005900 [Pseudohyphozyma bogoriensis]
MRQMADKEKDKDKAAGDKATASAPKAYKYGTEISQMCYVFGEKDPAEEIVQYIEDIVRLQLAEMVAQAKAQAARRGSRQLSIEDLLFLIRHDPSKLHRLRTFLSWQDVRRRIKESQTEDADQDGIDSITEEPTNDRALKVQKTKIPITWDITNMYSEHLGDDSDAEDDDETEAYEGGDSVLKEADELTKNMTKEQYAHYADCRQASFTYRKGKRFRDFVNLGPYIEGQPVDEIMDVLGFLAYEMVRSLCETGRVTKQQLVQAKANAAVREKLDNLKKDELKLAVSKKGKERERKRGAGGGAGGDKEDDGSAMDVDEPTPKNASPTKKSRKSEPAQASPKSPPRVLIAPTSLFSEPLEPILASGTTTPTGRVSTGGFSRDGMVQGPQPPIQLQDVMGGYLGMQQGQSSLKANGMRNWRGGLRRAKPAFI